jgi:hypothetical protein
MDPAVARLSTPEECEIFIENVRDTHPELVAPARRRMIELRAKAHDTPTDIERDAWEVIYAYEEALFVKHGKRVGANYTRRKIKKDGMVAAIEHAVKQAKETAGYAMLKDMGLPDLTWESLVVKHPKHFSPEAVARAKQRLDEWNE